MKSSIPRSLRSCSTFRRSASFTHALTDSASPAATAAWLAAIRSESTVTDSRVFAVILTAYMNTTPMALLQAVRGRATTQADATAPGRRGDELTIFADTDI